MAECTVESDSVPQQPLVVLTKMAPMLQRNEREGWVFKDPLQLAAVSRQLRHAVLSSIQQRKRRHMNIIIHIDYIHVAGINVKNELLSSYSQMDCVDALMAFAQPNLLYLILGGDGKFLGREPILIRSLPLSVTSLVLTLRVDELGVDSPLDQILKAVASKTNLETLRINVGCYNDSVVATHKKGSPSVPKDSPFNHLLTMKNLYAFRFNYDYDSNGLLSPAQMADLVNRSQSKITHICYNCYYNTQEMDELFKAMSDVVRGNITNICCVGLVSFEADQLHFLARLPNWATIHFKHYGWVNRLKLDELGDRLLDVCCADDVHPERTLECSIGCLDFFLQEYMEDGGETQMEYARGDTVVRLSIGPYRMMELKHCPFSNSPDDCL